MGFESLISKTSHPVVAIASELAEYGLKRYDVTRKIQRVNKKLMKEIGQKVAEKRGHAWAPTSFLLDIWE